MSNDGNRNEEERKKKNIKKCAVWHESMLRCSCLCHFSLLLSLFLFPYIHLFLSSIHWHRPLIHVNYRHSKYIVIQKQKRYVDVFRKILFHFHIAPFRKIIIMGMIETMYWAPIAAGNSRLHRAKIKSIFPHKQSPKKAKNIDDNSCHSRITEWPVKFHPKKARETNKRHTQKSETTTKWKEK